MASSTSASRRARIAPWFVVWNWPRAVAASPRNSSDGWPWSIRTSASGGATPARLPSSPRECTAARRTSGRSSERARERASVAAMISAPRSGAVAAVAPAVPSDRAACAATSSSASPRATIRAGIAWWTSGAVAVPSSRAATRRSSAVPERSAKTMRLIGLLCKTTRQAQKTAPQHATRAIIVLRFTRGRNRPSSARAALAPAATFTPSSLTHEDSAATARDNSSLRSDYNHAARRTIRGLRTKRARPRESRSRPSLGSRRSGSKPSPNVRASTHHG